MVPAEHAARILAMLVDMAVSFAALFCVLLIADCQSLPLILIILLGILIIYEWLCIGILGTSLGKAYNGVFIVTHEGRPPGLFRAGIRIMVQVAWPMGVSILAFIGDWSSLQDHLIGLSMYIVVLLNPKHRGIHDYVAGTYPVQAQN